MIYILNQGSNCIMNKQCWNFCETASYKAEKKTVENGQNSHIYLVYCTVLILQMINHEQYTRYCIYDNVLNMWTKYNFFHLPPLLFDSFTLLAYDLRIQAIVVCACECCKFSKTDSHLWCKIVGPGEFAIKGTQGSQVATFSPDCSTASQILLQYIFQ